MSKEDAERGLYGSFKPLPSNRPQFLIYQLNDRLKQSEHIEDYRLVAVINVSTAQQAAVIARDKDWTTCPDVELFVSETKDKPLRPCDNRDLIEFRQEDGRFACHRITEVDGKTVLFPTEIDATQRRTQSKLHPELTEEVSVKPAHKTRKPGDKDPKP